MRTEQFIEEITQIVKKVFSIHLKEDVINILNELLESYKAVTSSSIMNIVEQVEEPILSIKRIFKGKNQKNEDVLLIYFEDDHGIILNLSNPSKSQIGTLPNFAF